MNDILGRSAKASREQPQAWCSVSLKCQTVVVLTTLCTLVLLLPAACSWLERARNAVPAVVQLVEAEQRQPAPDSATFAICVMMRVASDDPQWVEGRAEDVHEWLEYHKGLGVGRVYVIDHLSDVPLNETLRQEIALGYVSYEYSTMPGGPQLEYYQQCMAKHGSAHKYMAFIDSDEFFVLTDKRPSALETLPALMDSYDAVRPFGGFVVPWVVFGSSGHVVRPQGGTIRNYWSCLDRRGPLDSRHVKTIVNTAHALGTRNPHEFHYKEPFYAIDEKFERADGAIMPEGRASVDSIALHHYVLKSLQDFEAKARRGAGDGTQKGMEFFRAIDALATRNCTALLGSAR